MAELITGKYGNYYRGNEFLNIAQMIYNAGYINAYLQERGWTLNAIAGMLGNMQTESTINPAIWQNLTESPSNGYGLVQWTPSTKFTDWCHEREYDPASMDNNLKRIEWEIEQGEQWIATDAYPLSFAEFKVSTASPEYLADAFLKNYERPADGDQPARADQAREWYNLLGGTTPPSPDPDNPDIPYKKSKMPLWLLVAATRRN